MSNPIDRERLDAYEDYARAMAGVDVMPVYAEDMQALLKAYAERDRLMEEVVEKSTALSRALAGMGEARADRDRLAAHVGSDVSDFDYPPGTAPCLCQFSTTDPTASPLVECEYHKARTAERDRLRDKDDEIERLRARVAELERTDTAADELLRRWRRWADLYTLTGENWPRDPVDVLMRDTSGWIVERAPKGPACS